MTPKLRLAIVGAGPAGIYAADILLKTERAFDVSIDLFEQLPAPYGLVRYGVAPDHPRIKGIITALREVLDTGDIRLFGNVYFGRDITLDDLKQHYNAVIFSTGAIRDAPLPIPGIDLPGSYGAADFVSWYDGHPDFPREWPLDAREVAVIGNGNVALDVARILTADPDRLAGTDISDHALEVLRGSGVREVVVAARRDPRHSAFTLPELIGLTQAAEVTLDAGDHELVRRDLATVSDALTRTKLEILSKLSDASAPVTRPRIRLAYRLTPTRVIGSDRVTGIEFTGADGPYRLDAGLVLSSIGYRGRPIADLPFDDDAAVVPNDGGRVIEPDTGEAATGSYVAGWIKRGPTGFIGTNKTCSMQTVAALVTDFNAGLLADPVAGPRTLARLVHARQPEVVDAAGWKAINAAEIQRGGGRPRDKFTRVSDMLAAARTAPRVGSVRGWLTGILGR